MPLAGYEAGSSSSGSSKKKRPRITVHTADPIKSLLYSSKPSAPQPSYPTIQPVIHSGSPLRRDPGPYSIIESAWGASAFPKQSKFMANVLPRLRSRLQDEPSFNSILSQLMNDRYNTFEDRLDRRFDHQRAVYQQDLTRALDAQRKGLPYETPEMPELPKIPRGQGVNNLVQTFMESVKPGMSPEVKDAYTNFYKYELTRLLDYKNDIRGQRNSLAGYLDNYLTDSRADLTRTRHDRQKARGEGTSPATPTADGTTVPTPSDSPDIPTMGKSDVPAVGILGELNQQTSRANERWDSAGEPKGPYSSLKKLMGAPDLPGSDVLDSVLNKIGDEAKDPLFWAIDKLSRPVYGVNNATKAFYNADADKSGANVWDGAFLAGKNPLESLDDIVSHPSKLGDIGSEFWQGFSGKDKTLFSQIIAENAKNDNVHDFRDSHLFQGGAGFVGDVFSDPLTYVGLGVITKPIQLTKDIRNSRELMQTATEASDLLGKGKEQVYSGLYDSATKEHIPAHGPLEKPYTPKEVYDLMVGSGHVTSKAGKVRNLADTNYRLQRLLYRIDNLDFVPDSGGLDDIKRLGGVLTEHKEALLKDFEGATVVDSLRHDLKIKIANGSEPSSALNEFDDLLTSTYLENKLIQANQYHQYLDRMAEDHFNVKSSYDTIEVPKKGSRTVATPTNLMGRKENIRVDVGGTDTVPIKRKTRAWQNVEKQYENRKSLLEKETDPQKKALRQRDLDAMRTKIEKILNEAPGGTLSELLPELVKDYRLTPAQVDNLGQEAFMAAWDNPRFRKLSSDSKGIYKQVTGGHNMQIRESARTRWEFVNRQKNRILGDTAVKILRGYFEKSEPYKDMARVREIRSEISRLDKEYGVPKVNSKDEPVLDGWGNDQAQQYRRQLHEELQSLKGYPDSGTKRSLVSSIPERFTSVNRETGEITFDLSKLQSAIRVDLRSGKSEINPFYGMFRILPTIEKTEPETYRWLMDMRNVLQERYEPIFDLNYAPVRDAKRKFRDQGITPNKTDNANFAKWTRTAAQNAEKKAFDSIGKDIAFGRLDTIDYYDEVPLRFLDQNTPEDQLLEALKWKFNSKEAQLKIEKYTAQRTKADEEVKRIDQQLVGLRQQYTQELARQQEIVSEAKQAKTVMSKRLREEALLTAAQMSVSPLSRQLSLRVIGKDLAIPHSDAMFKAVESMSGLPLIKQTRQAYANAFKSPMSSLPEEMQLAAARALGQTPIIIEHHVNHLRETLGQIPEHQRVRAWDSILKGHGNLLGEDGTQDAINAAFDDLLPYFRGHDMGDAGRLSVEDINRYLPEEFRLNTNYVNKHGVDTVQKLANAIRFNKNVSRADRSQLKDPYRVSWALRIGVEQASSRKALEHTINSTFGIKDLKIVKGTDPSVSDLMGEFQKLGWRRIPQLNNQHLFPPEVIPDINHLLDMMEPRNITNVGRLFDRVTGYWKTMTTIYNPGYWTRNGIGEVMSGWLGGVTDPRWYERSFNGVIKYARGDGHELDALKKQFSMLEHIPSESVTGARQVGSLKDGTPITAEQAWVAYNDQGLKSGFINTEFDSQYSRLGDIARSHGGTQSVANMHMKLRTNGEWYEDGLRIAHFLYAMNNSGAKTIEKAASHAAKEVRKYHFDYTDFTNFEKTVMLRAFPFYKWTRKALPLMATMLFTKPGKMLAYPKAMNTVQNTVTSQDIAADDNGFAPNYGDLVPGWIQDLWAYQIAGKEEEGHDTTYFNLNTPQMDSLKAMTSPGPTAYGLLNPLIKTPIEAGQIITGNGGSQSILKNLANTGDFSAGDPMNVELQTDDQNKSQAFLTALLRDTPQGSFLTKFGLADGKGDVGSPSGQELFSFLSGLGTYENNDARRMGVMYDKGK